MFLPLTKTIFSGERNKVSSNLIHTLIISTLQEERTGVINRNDIGFLIYDKDDLRTAQHNLGSRLKTPLLPIWITRCNDQVGLLFNPNRELMRSYHAENR